MVITGSQYLLLFSIMIIYKIVLCKDLGEINCCCCCCCCCTSANYKSKFWNMTRRMKTNSERFPMPSRWEKTIHRWKYLYPRLKSMASNIYKCPTSLQIQLRSSASTRGFNQRQCEGHSKRLQWRVHPHLHWIKVPWLRSTQSHNDENRRSESVENFQIV